MSVCPFARCSLSETQIRPPSVAEVSLDFLRMEMCSSSRGMCVDILSLQKAVCVLNSKRWLCKKQKTKKKKERKSKSRRRQSHSSAMPWPETRSGICWTYFPRTCF